MTRARMMREMNNSEFMEWLALDRIHPLPDSYWQAAMIAFTVARAMGAKKVKFEDFLPRKGKARRQTGPEMLAVVAGVVDAAEKRKGNT